MADKSKIEWTNATWNPITGCSKVSAGCKNCYAERDWKRLSANSKSVYFGRSFNDVATHAERLEQPLRWRDPRMIFVNSMSDLFHQDVPREFIVKVFAIMAMAKEHTFQVLTKRAERLSLLNEEAFQLEVSLQIDEYAERRGWCVELEQWPLPNVWLGVSVENQEAADERIPLLLQAPAAIRWISAEPLLGSVNLDWLGPDGSRWAGLNALTGEERGPHESPEQSDWLENSIDWVVAGGESGTNARPSHPDWFRRLRDQCLAANVPFFFKQWGNNVTLPMAAERGFTLSITDALNANTLGRGFVHISKKLAGRELDGRTWDELPDKNVESNAD